MKFVFPHFWRKKRFVAPLVLMITVLGTARLNETTFPAYPASDHHDPNTAQFFNTPPTRPVKITTARELWQMVWFPERYRPAGTLPTQTPDWQNFFDETSSRAKFVWLGHSTLLARVGGQTILFDPVYAKYAAPVPIMMKRFQAPPVALTDLPPIDWIVYSHAHYDHLDKDVVKYFVQHQSNTKFIAPLGVGAYLREWGVADGQIRELDWWQQIDLNQITLHATPTRHDASRTAFDSKKSLWASWVLQTQNEQIYFSGDSSQAGHFAEIGQRFGGFDLAFIENGQYNEAWADNHLFPEQTVQAAMSLRAKRWMPIHWAAYPLSTHAWDASVRESARLSEAQQLPMLTPMMGQVFDSQTITEKWWEKVK